MTVEFSGAVTTTRRMPQPLPIYLRTYRKRGCLTQGELGFLLGSRSGTKISRYERLARTPTLKTAIREHKGTLRQLACLPDSEVKAEREAIVWADTAAADEALEAALEDWENLPEPPNVCSQCGSSLFRWDIQGNRHCVQCDPGQSQRVRQLAESMGMKADNLVKCKSPEVQ